MVYGSDLTRAIDLDCSFLSNTCVQNFLEGNNRYILSLRLYDSGQEATIPQGASVKVFIKFLDLLANPKKIVMTLDNTISDYAKILSYSGNTVVILK